ncbi:MAG: DNA-binding protein [Alphaproteobacteria bacterium]|nr:MAG: DNA-binding protein [Alphaproteobacteria bacterium]
MLQPRIALTIKEACFRASLSPSTIYKLSRSGRLPIRKVCGRSLILADELDDFLKRSPIIERDGEGGAT